ncbi:MAG: SIMPL domain-containing protein [Candidatus Limnocylindrales bacterium]|jgi:hypothetical protein
MNLSPTLTRPTKSLLAGLLLVTAAALAIGWTAGTVAASSGTRIASAPAAPGDATAGQSGIPGVGTTPTQAQSGGGATTSGGTTAATVYPVPGYNSLGIAPAGTILAEGTGTADMKADGSDKATALKTATDAALADAHAQALAAATSMGVQLNEIYSLSIASNTSYDYPTPDCLIPPLAPGLSGGATSSAGSAAASSPMVCTQVQPPTPTSAQVVVTLIVAYKYA